MTEDGASGRRLLYYFEDVVDRRLHRVLIGLIAVLAVIDAGCLVSHVIALSPAQLLKSLAPSIVLVAISIIYGIFRPAAPIAATALAGAELGLFSLVGSIFSYLMIGTDRPLADNLLAHWDQLTGFSWLDYLAFVRGHAWLAASLDFLYHSSLVQIGGVVLFLGFTGRFRLLDRFIANLLISATIVIVVGAFLPAYSTYRHYGVADYGVAEFDSTIEQLRAGTLRLIDLSHMQGVISFPSYHAVISVTLILACWPVRCLRYPMLGLNLALIAGVPVYGGHYLADILAGVLVAVVTNRLFQGWLSFDAGNREAMPHPDDVGVPEAVQGNCPGRGELI